MSATGLLRGHLAPAPIHFGDVDVFERPERLATGTVLVGLAQLMNRQDDALGHARIGGVVLTRGEAFGLAADLIEACALVCGDFAEMVDSLRDHEGRCHYQANH